MRILVSTFADGDDAKVLLAMRTLPYDQLVLLAGSDAEGPSLEKIRKLEGLSGNDVRVEPVESEGFLAMVDSISEHLAGLALGKDRASRNEVVLNISGGSKIMGDAALLAAFRLGLEAYHCDNVVTKLPVVKGATAKDRFTELQTRLLDILADGEMQLGEVLSRMLPNSKSSAERTIRELKKAGLLGSRADRGVILVSLMPVGAEVARSSKYARAR